MRTALDLDDSHECGPLCREWENAGETIVWHDVVHGAPVPAFVTIGSARYATDDVSMLTYLSSLGIDWQ